MGLQEAKREANLRKWREEVCNCRNSGNLVKTHRNGYTYENDRIETVSHNTTSDTSNDVTYTFT